jgi:hypothetical protein
METRAVISASLNPRNNSPENDLPNGGPNTAVLHVNSKLREEELHGDIFWISYHMRHPTDKATYAIRSRSFVSIRRSICHTIIHNHSPARFFQETHNRLACAHSQRIACDQPASAVKLIERGGVGIASGENEGRVPIGTEDS